MTKTSYLGHMMKHEEHDMLPLIFEWKIDGRRRVGKEKEVANEKHQRRMEEH